MSLCACKTLEHTQADPVNLTQYLLKSRGLSYDESDYKKYDGDFIERDNYDFGDYKYILEDDKAYIVVNDETYDLNVKGYPIGIYNTNILKTNCEYYEVICTDNGYSLRKIGILSCFYEDVRNIMDDYVITEDYTMLPIKELLGKDYDSNKFYYDDGVRYID